jgi:hypothetical protein
MSVPSSELAHPAPSPLEPGGGGRGINRWRVRGRGEPIGRLESKPGTLSALCYLPSQASFCVSHSRRGRLRVKDLLCMKCDEKHDKLNKRPAEHFFPLSTRDNKVWFGIWGQRVRHDFFLYGASYREH